MKATTIAAVAYAAALGIAGGAVAQDEAGRKFSRVALYKDWSVFASEDKNKCFIASKPERWAATQNGEDVTARTNRGDIHLYVTSIKSDGIANEVAFYSGYPFRDGSTVTVQIGNETYEMFTEGEIAWPMSPEEDRKVVAGMRRGAKAVVTGLSSRGKTTIDTFSLIGFSDAIKDANGRCGIEAAS